MSCWLCVQTADHQLLAAVGEDPSVFVVMTLVFSSFSRLTGTPGKAWRRDVTLWLWWMAAAVSTLTSRLLASLAAVTTDHHTT